MFHKANLFDFDLADLPFSVVSEQSGDGFYIRAAGGVSTTPGASTVMASAVSFGGTPRTVAEAFAKAGGSASSSAFGIAHSGSRATANLF
jgi:hypothetical protein